MPINLILGVVVLASLVFAVVLFNFFGLWLRARISGAPVGMGTLIAMKLRGLPVAQVVDARITAVKAGLPIETDPLEAHYLAGGNVNQVILALIAAEKSGIEVAQKLLKDGAGDILHRARIETQNSA